MSSLIRKASKIIVVTPVVSTTPAYSAGDQVGGLNVIPNAAHDSGGVVLLQSISVIDKGKQKAALTCFFFDDLPTIASIDNGAFDLTDAQMALSCIGFVLIPSANYQDSSSNSIATVANCGLMLKTNAGNNAVPIPSGATKTSLWCVLMTTGTPTYVSTDDLRVKFGFEQY
jgi:hypothetical protein